MVSWQKQVGQVATAIAVISGIVMILSVGFGDVLNIAVSPDSISAETNEAFGGTNNPNGTILTNGVDFIDRIAVITVGLTVLGSAGLGVITVSGNNPPFLNVVLRYLPIIVGFVALTSFTTEVNDVLSGDRTWSAFGDIENSYMLFLASSVVAGLMALFSGNRR